MVLLTIETGNMVTTERVEEAVWSNDLVSDVDVGHLIDVVFSNSQSSLVTKICCVNYNVSGNDVTDKPRSGESCGQVDQLHSSKQIQALFELDGRL